MHDVSKKHDEQKQMVALQSLVSYKTLYSHFTHCRHKSLGGIDSHAFVCSEYDGKDFCLDTVPTHGIHQTIINAVPSMEQMFTEQFSHD